MKIKNLELVLQASVESIVKKTTEGFLPVITRVQDHMKYLQGEIQLLSTTLRNHHTPTTEHNTLMVDSLSKVSSRQEDIFTVEHDHDNNCSCRVGEKFKHLIK